MDQAQLLSLIGSLYDKLVEDVAQRVATMNKESLAYLVDASVTESIDARIQTWAGYNLSHAIATWVENNLDLDDQIENWVENNLDLEDAAREAVGEIDLGDSVREIIKNELTFSVSVD